jgi:hypothetical protein
MTSFSTGVHNVADRGERAVLVVTARADHRR